jgi:hypothetical protein
MPTETTPALTLFEAVQRFLGPLAAQYCRIIEEGSPDMPVTIMLGGYEYKTTLADIKALDRAYAKAFDDKQKRACRKARGGLTDV